MVALRPIFYLLAAGVFAAFASFGGVANAWSSVAISRTLSIDGTPFYLPSESTAPFKGSLSTEALPITVIVTSDSKITSETIKSAIAGFKSDDVFSESFLRGASTLFSFLFLWLISVSRDCNCVLRKGAFDGINLSGVLPVWVRCREGNLPRNWLLLVSEEPFSVDSLWT